MGSYPTGTAKADSKRVHYVDNKSLDEIGATIGLPRGVVATTPRNASVTAN